MEMTWLIGQECKCSNALSGLILIGRGLDQRNRQDRSLTSGVKTSGLLVAEHYIVLRVQDGQRSGDTPLSQVFLYGWGMSRGWQDRMHLKSLYRFLVDITRRTHPFPSRTRKLSFSVPTILGWRRPGKIGLRQNYIRILSNKAQDLVFLSNKALGLTFLSCFLRI